MIWASHLQFLFLLTLYSFSVFSYKECNQSDFAIDHLVMSMYKAVFCVVEKGYLLWPESSLGRILLASALLHFVLQGQTCLLLQVSLDYLLFHSNPLWWIGHLILVLVLWGLIGLQRTDQFQLFCISGWGIHLVYYDVEQFALEINWDHSVIFEVASLAIRTPSLIMRATP